ncbi:hypothetical protein [Fulvivirga lutea]|uniref:Uncharacterized protein n=1 Tax=Fulvivirga lutea TaxID=2810512 RepID=A0A974WI59_9BACT|nr:hypothetical protein [Fulvivirga lutea]QSE98866.1 hypothetical protein JR347_07235 [Fulvivirga lutea]
MDKLKPYKPSGKYGVFTVPILLACVAFVYPILAIIYASFIFYMPWQLINVGLFIGMLYLFPKIIALVIQLAKIRNTNLGLFTGLGLTLWFYYLHWAVWVRTVIIEATKLTGSGDFELISSILPAPFELVFHPGVLWDSIVLINDNGIWGFEELAVSGFFLWIVWLIELLGFMLMGMGTWLDSVETPFSEESDLWHAPVKSTPLTIIDPTPFKNAIMENNPALLAEASAIEKGRDDYSIITLYTCPRGTEYLSLSRVFARTGARGAISYESKVMVSPVAIKEDFAKAVRIYFKERKEKLKELRKPNLGKVKAQILQDKSVQPLPKKEIKETLNEETQIRETEAEISNPAIAIGVNAKTSSSRLLGAIVTLGIGAFLIYISTQWGDTHVEGLIFGSLLSIIGVVQLASSAFSASAPKHAYAMKISPSNITLGNSITGDADLIIIPTNKLRNVTSYVGEGGSRSITLILWEKLINNEDFIDLDIAMAKGDWLEIKDLLNSLVGKPVQYRQAILKEFLDKKPSMRYL